MRAGGAAAAGLRQLPTGQNNTGKTFNHLSERHDNNVTHVDAAPDHSLAPALHDPSVLLGSQRVAGRLRQRLDLTGQIVAAGTRR